MESSNVQLSLLKWLYAFLAFTISANSGLSEAPPTKNPSTSCWVAIIQCYIYSVNEQNRAARRTKFLAVGRGDASSVNNTSVVRYGRWDSLGEVCAHVNVRLLRLRGCGDLTGADGPDGFVCNHDVAFCLSDQRKVTDETAYLQSPSLRTSTTAFNCSSQTSAVFPASRSWRVSPMQRITLRPASRAARVLVAMSSEVSLKIVRRSEWPIFWWDASSASYNTDVPRITYGIPASTSCLALDG